MKTNEASLNSFELSILRQMADQFPPLLPVIAVLTVTSREFTGAGSFTNFAACPAVVLDACKGPLRSTLTS
jgi:hypothetical protein